MKEKINIQVDALRDELYEVSQFIGKNPELGHQEYKAAKILCDTLKKHGFKVEMGTCGLETAFEAVYESAIEGPHIGFLAEYDALPDIGHACGHNLIGTMSIAAAIALKTLIDTCGGKIYVYGTPAEETAGGKVTMAEAGVLNHLDVAMMIHPLDKHQKSGTSLAMDPLKFEFFGKSVHAAAAPHEGINALDAVIQTFNAINALRQQTTPDVRIHGIITDGGKAPNIIPDYAAAKFYVRAAKRQTVDEMVKKVIACAEGAALQTGTRLEVSYDELSYDNMVTNETLSKLFTQNLIGLGIDEKDIFEKEKEAGSSDIGNVSRVVPSIHPYIKISEKPCQTHTKEFTEASLSEMGLEATLLGAKCLANTAYDILTNKDLLKSIKEEFNLQK